MANYTLHQSSHMWRSASSLGHYHDQVNNEENYAAEGSKHRVLSARF